MNETSQCSLLGHRVEYVVDKSKHEGVIVDKILVKDQEEPRTSVTAYMILDDKGNLWPVPHWRIRKYINQ